jgi:hypothetical protein
MEIKNIKIKSSEEIVKPIGNLYFCDENNYYDIPLKDIEVVDDNLVDIDDVTNLIATNFDFEKYISLIICGVGTVSFDVDSFLSDLKTGLKRKNNGI